MLPSPRRPLNTLLSLVLATSVVGATVPAQAVAASLSLGAAGSQLGLGAAEYAAPATVLGLESEDTKAGQALTVALRGAFKKRGLSGGEELSLLELRLTMGCENDEPGCLSEGGKTLGVDRLIFGYLRPTDADSYQLELNILDVGLIAIENTTNVPVSAAELEPDRIDATATAIVNSMFPEEQDPDPTPTGTHTVPVDDPDDPVVTEDKEPREGRLWFGRDKNSPTWKKAGLGVGLGLAVIGLTAVLAFAVPSARSVDRRGWIYRRLEDAAKASLKDGIGDGINKSDDGSFVPFGDRAVNDVDPSEVGPDGKGIDMCALATTIPEPSMPGAVYNKNVAEVCADGKVFANIATAGIVVMSVGLATTIVFGTLLLVHRKTPGTQARRERNLRFGAAPSRGGFSLGTRLNF